jgi:hypothetical protein
MRIDSSGNVGIGTSSPNVALDVVSGSVNTSGDSLTDQTSSVTGPNRAFSTHVGVLNVATNTAAGIDVGGSIGFGGRWTGTVQAGFALIKGAKENASTGYASYLAFYTRPDSTPMSERMRITSAGLVGIGTATPNTFSFNNLVVASGASNAGMAIYGTGQTTLAFATATSGSDSYRGYIQYTGGGTDTMAFGTAATERMRITSGGNLLVGTTTNNASGGVIQVSNGITFPATQSASSDANTLDDYEEGTWTATLKGSTTDPTTPVTTTAKYTKIGNVVYYQVSFENVNTTGAAGNITVSGLPFTPANGNRYMGSAISYNLATWSGQITVMVDNNLTSLYLYGTSSNAAWGAATHNAGTTRYMSLTGFYYV